MANGGLPPLPKQEDFAPEPMDNKTVALRAVSVALAQLGGNPELAAAFARIYENQDQARAANAESQFRLALSRASEERQGIVQEEQLKLSRATAEREQATAKRSEAELDLSRQRESRLAAEAKAQLGMQARQLELSELGLVGSALDDATARIHKELEGSQVEISTGALIDPTLIATAMGQPREKSIPLIAEAIMRAEEAKKLAAAFPGIPPEAKAEKIAGIIHAAAQQVPEGKRAQFIQSLQFYVPSATAANLASGVPLPPEQWLVFSSEFTPQLADAMVSGRNIEMDEMRIFATGLKAQIIAGKIPQEELLKQVSGMVDRATQIAVTKLGLPPEANEGYAREVATRLGELIKGADDVAGVPFALRGTGDPARRKLLEEALELETQAAELRATLLAHPERAGVALELAKIEARVRKLRAPETFTRAKEQARETARAAGGGIRR